MHAIFVIKHNKSVKEYELALKIMSSSHFHSILTRISTPSPAAIFFLIVHGGSLCFPQF
jgi:hypothetical protein